jgi:hypothetical protein
VVDQFGYLTKSRKFAVIQIDVVVVTPKCLDGAAQHL